MKTEAIEPGSHYAASGLGPLLLVPATTASAISPENTDLRRQPIYKARRILSPYDQAAGKVSDVLPIGTQARFLAAALAAAQQGTALNLMITLRWRSLFSDGEVRWMRCLPIPQRIDTLVQRLRKWLDYRGVPPLYIWVREAAGPEHEHLHIALHLPRHHRQAFIAYIASLTEEPRIRRRHARTEGEIARGEAGSWHIAGDTRPERQGHYLAAYLGKGEPSQRMFRGKLRGNSCKPVRGQSFGGDQPDGKYDEDQGKIQGTPCRGARFFVSKTLQRLVASRVL
jgi:hypothetical protein